MAFYYDNRSGLARTKRPVENDDTITCVTGKLSAAISGNVYRPATSTLKYGAWYPGIKYFEVVTPTVKRVARSHFNCPTMNGLRLENQPTGDGE